jgi:site-specific recombinase XerD
LRREVFNRSINTFLEVISPKLEDKPRITSHSFRIGYITRLWKDSKDIEFVRQIIGHSKINTTSRYVQELSESEIKIRITEISG